MAVQTTIRVKDGGSSQVAKLSKTIAGLVKNYQRLNKLTGNSNGAAGFERTANAAERLNQSLQKAGATMQTLNGDATSTASKFQSLGTTVKSAFIETPVKRMASAQKEVTKEVSRSTSAMNNFGSVVKRALAMFGGIAAIGKTIGLADELSQTTARLNMINDGLQSTEDLQKMIFASAQRSRGAYQDTADAVAKIGLMAKDAFSSNAELVAFMEQVNKQFAIAGTSSEGVSAAMLQLTQAMGSGVLRGEELNSVFEQAPTIIQTIADYLDKPIGKIRDMAKDGKLTASVVKNALLYAADETNAKFEQMPRTFAQIFTSIKNYALMAFQPVLERLSELANSEAFQVLITNIVGVLVTAANAVIWAFEQLSALAQFVSDNWSVIGPIVWGVVAAFAAYYAIMLLVKAVSLVVFLIQNWWLLLIVALVALFAVFGEQATGVLAVIGAAAANTFFEIANFLTALDNAANAACQNIEAWFNNVWVNVQIGAKNMAIEVKRQFMSLVKWINGLGIPFVEIDGAGIAENITDSVRELNGLRKQINGNYVDVGAAWDAGMNTHEGFKKGWAKEAYEGGASAFAGLRDKLANNFGIGDFLKGSAADFIGDLGGDASLGALDAFNIPDAGAGNLEAGVKTEINEKLDEDSEFMQLTHGMNTLKYDAESGIDYLNIKITYRSLYLGV
ncbi:tape measure protein [Eubacteriales bacterium OttesenSCG-928-A19]|nr:tape measure protein [Eubacteriales bacterium OttesenSCG-928-A19]